MSFEEKKIISFPIFRLLHDLQNLFNILWAKRGKVTLKPKINICIFKVMAQTFY